MFHAEGTAEANVQIGQTADNGGENQAVALSKPGLC